METGVDASMSLDASGTKAVMFLASFFCSFNLRLIPKLRVWGLEPTQIVWVHIRRLDFILVDGLCVAIYSLYLSELEGQALGLRVYEALG